MMDSFVRLLAYSAQRRAEFEAAMADPAAREKIITQVVSSNALLSLSARGVRTSGVARNGHRQ